MTTSLTILIGAIATLVGVTVGPLIASKATAAPPRQADQNANSQKWRSDFKISKKKLGPEGNNPYFPMTPGLVLEFKSADGQTSTRSVLEKTAVIDGVTVRVIVDRETNNGTLVEITRDYYACDKSTGDVYYMGEDVDVYKDGKVVDHPAAWLSGKRGARFGLQLPGKLSVGDAYYQEIAPKVAMDRVEILEDMLTVKTPFKEFSNCLRVEETTPLEKGKSTKWYAPGLGIVKDDELELVSVKMPK